jgi:hypothetical protein
MKARLQHHLATRQDGHAQVPLTSIFVSDLQAGDLFDESGVQVRTEAIGGFRVDQFAGEFWTAGQRQASSLHEVSYRACFKPQLPRYFIRRFSSEGDRVYDPFSGRGTTAIEAALQGRSVVANDVNPLSEILARPRLNPPTTSEVESRLRSIAVDRDARACIDLSMFYHPETESEIESLRRYLRSRRADGQEDSVDGWIRMVATNRLTGHSPGFFSVYTFPPNQAVSAEAQVRINQRRRQEPEYRDTRALVLSKTKSLLSNVGAADLGRLRKAAEGAQFLTNDARRTREIRSCSVQLTVTSPPFLDVVQYADDNWLRCWFNDLDIQQIASGITMARTVDSWRAVMTDVFHELFRIAAKGGVVAFEVGEVRNGKVRLEEHVVPIGTAVGFECVAVLINEQNFTKTSNIWGVKNNNRGTNTNRIVVFRKS